MMKISACIILIIIKRRTLAPVLLLKTSDISQVNDWFSDERMIQKLIC